MPDAATTTNIDGAEAGGPEAAEWRHTAVPADPLGQRRRPDAAGIDLRATRHSASFA